MAIDDATRRIERDHLLGLLDTMTPVETQRITAEITVPRIELTPELDDEISQTAQDILADHAAREPDTATAPPLEPAACYALALPSLGFSITFRVPSRRPSRLAVISASFAATLVLGLLLLR